MNAPTLYRHGCTAPGCQSTVMVPLSADPHREVLCPKHRPSAEVSDEAEMARIDKALAAESSKPRAPREAHRGTVHELMVAKYGPPETWKR